MNEEEAKIAIKKLKEKYGDSFSHQRRIFYNKNELSDFLVNYKWAKKVMEGLYLLEHPEIKDRPLCPHCNKELDFLFFCNGYKKFCNCHCRAKHYECFKFGITEEAITKKRRTRKINYAKNSEEILKKRDITILKKYNSVSDAFKARGEKSAATAKERRSELEKTLYNKDFAISLFKKYKSCSMIAKYYLKDSSPYASAFVASVLKEHGIEIKKNNHACSVQESEIKDYIKTIYYGEVKFNVRGIIGKKELDIYIPELNIAFEYCGLYWHNEKRQGRTSHLDKMVSCNELGIRLVTIFEDEWISKKSIVQDKIRHMLGEKAEVIGARKTKIVIIDNKTANIFHDKYHIQGSCSGLSKINYGIYYQDELVGVCSLGKSRYNKNYTTELLRYTTSKRVIGGLGKILKKHILDNPTKNIVSYCDLRWGTGNLYKEVGFNLVGISKPSYWYFNPSVRIRYHRSRFMKSKLIKQGGNPEMTEYEIMLNKGYRRIWDCGCQVWELNYDVGE